MNVKSRFKCVSLLILFNIKLQKANIKNVLNKKFINKLSVFFKLDHKMKRFITTILQADLKVSLNKTLLKEQANDKCKTSS